MTLKKKAPRAKKAVAIRSVGPRAQPPISDDDIQAVRRSLAKMREECMADLIGISATLEVLSDATQNPLKPVSDSNLKKTLVFLNRAFYAKVAQVDACLSHATYAAKGSPNG